MKYDMSDPAIRELLEGLEDETDPQPRPAPQPRPGQRFEPSQADIAAYSAMSERGIVPAVPDVRPKERPHHATNRWGKALKNWKNAGLPDVPKQ